MIAIAQALAMFGAGIRRFSYAIFLFILFAAFSPRTLGFFPAGNELSLTFPRLAFPLLVVLFVGLILTGSKRITLPFSRFMKEPIAIILLVMGLYKLLATVLNDRTPAYAIELLALSFGAMGIFYSTASRETFRMVNLALVLAVLALIVIIPLELALNQPIHYLFADAEVVRFEQLQNRIAVRGYRVQGIFDNSLSLAEFMLYALPFVLFGLATVGRAKRYLNLLLILVMLAVGYFTDSRGFLFIGLLTAASFWLFLSWNRLSLGARSVIFAVAVPVFVLSAIGVGYYVENLINEVAGIRFNWIASAEERSTFSRAIQVQEVMTAVQQQPFFGYGVLQNFSAELDSIRKIDNYYLRTLLESGIPGLVMFLLSLLVLARGVFRNRQRDVQTQSRALFALAASLLVAFAGAKIFLSMPTNNFVFYALMGLLMGLQVRIREGKLT